MGANDKLAATGHEPRRLIREGKAAVIVSPDFGAGWSSWNPGMADRILFDPEIALMILEGNHEQIEELAERKYPGIYASTYGLVVEWVPKGSRFVINEYDGSESLTIIGPDHGYVA